MTDVDYIVDLCDEVLGEPASRHHVFPWLRHDDGSEAPVTAYYEGHQLAIEVLYESRDLEALDVGLRNRLATLLARGIQPGLLASGMFTHDDTGVLRRRRAEDGGIAQGALQTFTRSDLDRHDWNIKVGLLPEPRRDVANYGPLSEDDEDDWDDEDIDFDDESEEWDEDEAEPVSGVALLGWRSRPIAQATLGGAVLGRRAFSSRYAGQHEALDIQLLVALLLGDEEAPRVEGHELRGLAVGLEVAPYELDRSIRRLLGGGLVERRGYPEEGDQPIGITPDGCDVVRSWLSRVALLFPGWPPDNPDVDDATGSD